MGRITGPVIPILDFQGNPNSLSLILDKCCAFVKRSLKSLL
jgi:hypothetical protein